MTELIASESAENLLEATQEIDSTTTLTQAYWDHKKIEATKGSISASRTGKL